MDFENEKKQALSKIDKSKKGSIDLPILSLVNRINKNKDFYTTSSCSGRILLIVPGIKKNKTQWPFVSHDKIDIPQIRESLKILPKETMWFRMEPPILHICCREMENADWLIKTSNEIGFRRSAILTFKKRIIVEIMIPEKMDIPISEDSKMLIEESYLGLLIKKANEKLDESHRRLKRLIKAF